MGCNIYGIKYKVVKVTSNYQGVQRYKTIKVFDDIGSATEFHFTTESKDNYFYIITVDYKAKRNGN